jgi:hypothetical protein
LRGASQLIASVGRLCWEEESDLLPGTLQPGNLPDEAFGRSDRSVSGFRPRHKNAAERVRIGDKLLCYMTRVSRWFGVLEVLEGPFRDNTPIFVQEADPFVVRFRVRPIVWLAVEKAVPIYEDARCGTGCLSPRGRREALLRGRAGSEPVWCSSAMLTDAF